MAREWLLPVPGPGRGYGRFLLAPPVWRRLTLWLWPGGSLQSILLRLVVPAGKPCPATTCLAWRSGNPSLSGPTAGRSTLSCSAPSCSCGELGRACIYCTGCHVLPACCARRQGEPPGASLLRAWCCNTRSFSAAPVKWLCHHPAERTRPASLEWTACRLPCFPWCRGNATITLDHTLAGYPGPLSLVCVQFPDPHFKARHK